MLPESSSSLRVHIDYLICWHRLQWSIDPTVSCTKIMNVGEFNAFTVIAIQSDADAQLEPGFVNVSVKLLHQPDAEPPITLPIADENLQLGQELSLFVRTDDQGDAWVTTERPLVTLNQPALLDVVTVRDTGTWLNWGLTGDLFMPRSECRFRVAVGDKVLICLYRDLSSDRLAATTRLHRHFSEHTTDLRPDQPVSLIVAGKTDLGFKAVVDQRYLGLLYADEVFQPLKVGDRVPGFVKAIRPDGKIDLTLQARPSDLRGDLSERIMRDLKAAGGRSTLTDKSPPEAIYARYQVSKKNYKKALGGLYRQRKIVIHADAIQVVD